MISFLNFLAAPETNSTNCQDRLLIPHSHTPLSPTPYKAHNHPVWYSSDLTLPKRKRDNRRTLCTSSKVTMAKFAVGEVAMVVVIACMLVGSAPRAGAGATITCLQVTNLLTPCISYGVMGGSVSAECCAGIRELNAAYKTTEDIRKACSCVKDGAAVIPGINYDRINEIPGKCNTTCPYKVYPDTDCSRVG